jgi:hypothetical protein
MTAFPEKCARFSSRQNPFGGPRRQLTPDGDNMRHKKSAAVFRNWNAFQAISLLLFVRHSGFCPKSYSRPDAEPQKKSPV